MQILEPEKIEWLGKERRFLSAFMSAPLSLCLSISRIYILILIFDIHIICNYSVYTRKHHLDHLIYNSTLNDSHVYGMDNGEILEDLEHF